MDVDCGTVGCVFLKEAMFLAMFVGLTVLCEEGTTVCFCLRDQMFKQWEAGHKNSRLDLFWNLFFSSWMMIWRFERPTVLYKVEIQSSSSIKSPEKQRPCGLNTTIFMV